MKQFFSTSFFRFIIIPFIGGAFYASAFPMANEASFFLGSLIGLTFLFTTLSFFNNDQKWKRDLLVIFAFSVGYTQLGYYWIPFTLKVFGAIPIPFNFILSLPFGLIITPHYFLFILAALLLSKIKNSTWKSLSAAIVLTLLEYFTPQQFPSHAGHPWLKVAPYLGLAPIFGAIIYSFITFWIAIFFTNLILHKKIDRLALAVSGILLLIGIISPIKKMEDSKPLNIRLVQANIGNNMKINSLTGDMTAREFVYNNYHQLSTTSSTKPIDLIIWPETAYPYLLSSQHLKDNPELLPELFKTIVTQTNAAIFFGGYDLVSNRQANYFEDQYNTTFMIGNDLSLKDYYHKRKLIPFGETLPLGIFKETASKFIRNISYFAEGERFPLFNINDRFFVSAICYEILFSGYIRSYLNSVHQQPHFIINVTNDSWYGKTSEPFQHLFLAKWRALEFNIPIVRMTNTGISSVLYPDGSESARIPSFIKKSLDVLLHSPTRTATTYQKYGPLTIILLWIGLGLMLYGKALFQKIMKADKS